MQNRPALALLVPVLLLGLAPLPALAQTPVRVDGVKPQKEDMPTLRFLTENRDSLQSRLDALHRKPSPARDGTSVLDPRFLAYRAMSDSLRAARDTMNARLRWEDTPLLASVTDLGRLETELDRLESLLDRQEARLRGLETDFAGRQETAVAVVVRGFPEQADRCPDALRLIDGFGNAVRADLGSERTTALRDGGVVQIYYDFAEPREQTWELDLSGGPWSGAGPAYLHFEPVRNALNFLELDLGSLNSDDGAASIGVRTWTRNPGTDRADLPR